MLTQSSLYPFCTLVSNSLQKMKFLVLILMLYVAYLAGYSFFCFLWSSTQDSVSQQAPLIPIFRSLVWAPVQQPWMNWVPEREAGSEKDRVQEKDEAKTKVSDQGSKFNFQLCVYIGKPHRPILCFSWIELQSKLSR